MSRRFLLMEGGAGDLLTSGDHQCGASAIYLTSPFLFPSRPPNQMCSYKENLSNSPPFPLRVKPYSIYQPAT